MYHVITNIPHMENINVDSDHTCSDHSQCLYLSAPISQCPSGLYLTVPFQSPATRTANKHFVKTEREKTNTLPYQHTFDEILNKIKGPYPLLVHGIQDPVTIKI